MQWFPVPDSSDRVSDGPGAIIKVTHSLSGERNSGFSQYHGGFYMKSVNFAA